MDMRFGTWNVKSLYRAGALGLVTSERKVQNGSSKSTGSQVEGNGTLESGNYTLFYGEDNANHQLGTGFYVHRQIRSAVKRVEFISDHVSCMARWSDIIVVNVHVPSEDDIKDSFYEEIE